jgi:twitching motility protein PilT
MDISIDDLMRQASAAGATDIHICCGAPLTFRVARDLVYISRENLTARDSRTLALKLLTTDQAAILERKLDFDAIMVDQYGRYRVNVGYFNGSIGATVRILPDRPRTLQELHLPDKVRELTGRTKGLVLVTGSTSQGKTTTVAAMIDEINTKSRKHIITIEDPIEYVHTNKAGIVRQREIGGDTESFATGLRAALRQDPDVLAIGEMRDYETIKIALTAAETGVMVFSTLHIISIDKIIERLLSYAAQDDQRHLRYLLADSLQGIIHQELVPTIEGRKRVACEVLIVTDAVRHIIRRRDTHFLRDIITTGKNVGMSTMNSSINRLLEEGVISAEVAEGVLRNYAR